MRSPEETRLVNHALMSNGLGSLSDPGLIRQIGFIVTKVVNDHEDFRALISRCDPAQRPAMYEALKPYVTRFTLKPLDFYIARSGELAEAKQLDTQDADGTLKPFRVPEIKSAPAAAPTDLQVAQKIMDEALAHAHLNMVCTRCTREETFHGLRKEDALGYARLAGWKRVVSAEDLPLVEICPKCSGHA